MANPSSAPSNHQHANTRRLSAALAAALACLTAASFTACHSPKGGWMPYTGGAETYESTETSPKSLSLVDVRTGEEIFAMDIPVGKQLVIDFDEGSGDDPVKTPDRMRYGIEELGHRIGSLPNSMTVPNAYSRRIDLSIRKGPEIAKPPAEAAYRVDKEKNHPSWWTPKGGEVPEKDGTTSYDN